MKPAIVVFGRGFLGRRLGALLRAPISPAQIPDDAAEVLEALRPGVVVNAVGKTGVPNIDWCETHRAQTWHSNTLGAVALGKACAARGIHYIQLSTGCLFHGASPSAEGWREQDTPTPMSFYARSKLAAEEGLAGLPGTCILRIRMPIDVVPSPRNIITRLAGYETVLRASNSMTVVGDLARVIRHVAERRLTGTYHATSPGTVAHDQLLGLYRERVDRGHACRYVDEVGFALSGLAVAPRSTCELSTERLLATGIEMRSAAAQLPLLLDEYARRWSGPKSPSLRAPVEWSRP